MDKPTYAICRDWGTKHIVEIDADGVPREGRAHCGAPVVRVPEASKQHLLDDWPCCRGCLEIECDRRGIPRPGGRKGARP